MRLVSFFVIAALTVGCGKSMHEQRLTYARLVRQGNYSTAVEYASEHKLYPRVMLQKKARVLLRRWERILTLPEPIGTNCPMWPEDLETLADFAYRAGLEAEATLFATKAFDCNLERGNYRQAEHIAHPFIFRGREYGWKIDAERHKRSAFLLWAYGDERLRTEYLETQHPLTEAQALEIFEYLWHRGEFERAHQFLERREPRAPISDARRADLERRYLRWRYAEHMRDHDVQALYVAHDPAASITPPERRAAAIVAFEQYLQGNNELVQRAYQVAVDEHLGHAYILRARRTYLDACSNDVPFPPRTPETENDAPPTTIAP